MAIQMSKFDVGNCDYLFDFTDTMPRSYYFSVTPVRFVFPGQKAQIEWLIAGIENRIKPAQKVLFKFHLRNRSPCDEWMQHMCRLKSSLVGIKRRAVTSKAPSSPATASKQHCRIYFGNSVERVFREISSFRQSHNKSNMFNLFRLSRKTRSTCSIRQCCFNFVSGVVGA